MIIKTIGKNRGNIFIWLALFIFSLIMPCAVQAALKVEAQPQDAVPWRGTTAPIIAVVTGTTSGSVWGGGSGGGYPLTTTSAIYTEDSRISTAAVHAGVLVDGKTGLVEIIPVASRRFESGSPSNGVTPTPYTGKIAGYTLKRYNYDISTTIADPGNFAGWGNFADLEASAAKTFKVSLTGVSSGRIWGTNTYTSDSLIALAAVHAGKLGATATNDVTVFLSAGRSSYEGSTRHDVTSNSFGSYGASFTFTDPCTATIDENLLFFIPSCTYTAPIMGETSFWLELAYVFSLQPVKPLFKLTDYGILDVKSCNSSPVLDTSSGIIKLTLSGVILPDGTIPGTFQLVQEACSGNDTCFRVTY
jgi:hypothetical protein